MGKTRKIPHSYAGDTYPHTVGKRRFGGDYKTQNRMQELPANQHYTNDAGDTGGILPGSTRDHLFVFCVRSELSQLERFLSNRQGPNVRYETSKRLVRTS